MANPAYATARREWLVATVGAFVSFGIAGCAFLGLAMEVFLLADWAAGIVPIVGFVLDRYLAVGIWVDGILGSRWFFTPSVWRALGTGVFIGIGAPLIGVFLIHRQTALIGETLAHTAFAGVAAGVVLLGLTGWRDDFVIFDLGTRGSLLFIAMIVRALGALGLQWLRPHSRTYGDVPIAIVLAESFAVGTLLITCGRDRTPITIDVEGLLFGGVAIVTALAHDSLPSFLWCSSGWWSSTMRNSASSRLMNRLPPSHG